MLIDAEPKVKMEVEPLSKRIHTPEILTALFSEFSAVTDYHPLRDSLPRRLASLLKCRCVLLFLRIGESLELACGLFDDQAGWSSSLLAVAHINPISLTSDMPETAAWRDRHSIGAPAPQPTLVAMPLIYRHRAIGILTALRSIDQAAGLDSGTDTNQNPASWLQDDLPTLDAIADVIALLLENTRLLEHDRERIHELSLLNSISNHLNRSMYDLERVRTVVIQRTREISNVD